MTVVQGDSAQVAGQRRGLGRDGEGGLVVVDGSAEEGTVVSSRNIRNWILGGVLSGVLILAGCTPQDEGHPLLRKAEAAYNQEDYRNAEVFLKKLLIRRPDHAERTICWVRSIRTRITGIHSCDVPFAVFQGSGFGGG